MEYGIIYKMTSPSGKSYVGQTISSLQRRRQAHESKAKTSKGKKYDSKLSKAIRKYGEMNKWEIIHDQVPVENLDQLEEQEVINYDSYKNGYNCTPGGGCGGAMRGKKLSESTKARLSDMRKGSNNPMYGKSGDKNPFYGKSHTDETKKKMKLNHADISGENNPMYGKSAWTGKKHKPETIEKMRMSAKNRKRK